MVEEIVQGHGGNIRMESSVLGENGSLASGTTFIMNAPISQPEQESRENSAVNNGY